MKYFRQTFLKSFDFEGRARRAEYWNFTLFNLIIVIALWLLASLATEFNKTLGMVFMTLYFIYSLLALIPYLAVSTRRLHDTGRSGWYLLIGLIPLAGIILLLVYFATDSQPEDNQYGKYPKEEIVNLAGI